MRLIFISIFFLCSLAISNLSAQGVGAANPENETRIYPNPLFLGQELHIQSGSEIFSIELLDMIGQLIIRKETDSFNKKSLAVRLEQCKRGVYIVKIRLKNNKYAIKKLLIKNQ